MIKPTDSVEELLEKYPGLNQFLLEKGIVCIKCGEPFWGPLEQIIRNKGMDVDEVLAEINKKFNPQ
jgi:hypothetical protein